MEFFAVHPPLPGAQEDRLAGRVTGLHTPDTLRQSAPELVQMDAFKRPLGERIERFFRRRELPVVGPRFHLDASAQIPYALAYTRGALQQALEKTRPDFLFVSPQLNPVALLLDLGGLPTRLVLASYDVEAVRVRRFAAARRGLARLVWALEARRALRFERENLARYDGVIAVSDLDQRHFVADYGFEPERVTVIENGVDPEYFAFAERRPPEDPQIVYVGSLGYWPNEQAAWRLLDRIMPLVRRRHPGACLSIVGQAPSEALLARSDGQRTLVTGRVDDVRPFLQRAAAMCVPLLAGSGTKYKVLEALSAGVPLVCSPLAAEGLSLRDGEHLLLAESDDALAAAVLRLVEDPALAARLARRGRAEVEARHAWDAVLPRLDGWLERLPSLPRRADRLP